MQWKSGSEYEIIVRLIKFNKRNFDFVSQDNLVKEIYCAVGQIEQICKGLKI